MCVTNFTRIDTCRSYMQVFDELEVESEDHAFVLGSLPDLRAASSGKMHEIFFEVSASRPLAPPSHCFARSVTTAHGQCHCVAGRAQ